MKTFVTARRHKFPQNRKPDPLGSHISCILGRKAHNGTMKTFVPQGAQWHNENICYRKAAQWYNENICYRKAHNGIMKTFVSQGAQ